MFSFQGLILMGIGAFIGVFSSVCLKVVKSRIDLKLQIAKVLRQINRKEYLSKTVGERAFERIITRI